jgi:uncharacterized protein
LQNAAAADVEELLPIVPYLARNAAGEPHLFGSKCSACGEIFLGSKSVCARCGGRATMIPIALASSGKVYVWTTVYRSLPGVATPFVFAIVDLEGGGVVKGTLDVPENEICFDMQVKIVFEKAADLDAVGRSYLTYYFAKA